ncbi:MAG: adenylosuccinate synthase [Polyangiales bacterium]
MPAVVVVGAQWGDEGKGKVVDLWSSYADGVVRFAGGANAGHTLVVRGEKQIFHLVPSGALHERIQCVIGQGTVIDPQVLVSELEWLGGRGLLDGHRVHVSDRAHLVLPHHKVIDGLREAGDGAIGTTKRGIGPAYEDKAGRRGLRVGDLLDADRFAERLEANLNAWRPVVTALGGELPNTKVTVEQYAGLGEALREHVGDTAAWVSKALARGDKLLFEGAQGTMLDVDHGTYPYVTSSTAIAGGACAGAGVGPSVIDRVCGISKAYTTRVGGGPFPTEIEGEAGNALREAGAEYGATTGRPRRCGWLDGVALRFAVQVNGLDEIALTKLDVLSELDEIRLCVAYEVDGQRLERPPWDGLERVTPVYETLPGWKQDVRGCSAREQLPAEAQRYLERIEEVAGCRVGLVSVGPDREQSVELRDPFDSSGGAS